MRTVHIREKLSQLGSPVEELLLGDFDMIGEFTAKKSRSPDSPLYKTRGCFFRPNYERGLLIYSLVRKYKVRTYLEIGFGRGYSSICAAKAMEDEGIEGGKITTIDPKFDRQHVQNLTRIFPQNWLGRLDFIEAKSQDVLPRLGSFDMIYVDGDHTYDAVRSDWEMCRDKWDKIILFDDYHMPTKSEKDIECARAIDEIVDPTKELVIMDRRIFQDDRGLSDDEIDYGQVLMTRESQG